MRQAATSEAAGVTRMTTVAMSSCNGAGAKLRTPSAIRVAARCGLSPRSAAVRPEQHVSPCAERSLLERPDLSNSQPARTKVSGLNDPTGTLEFIDTTHLPSHCCACQG